MGLWNKPTLKSPIPLTSLSYSTTSLAADRPFGKRLCAVGLGLRRAGTRNSINR